MQSVIGVFGSRVAAEQAVRGLQARGLSPQSIIFLSGEAGNDRVGAIPTLDAERDGMGETVGAVVGGSVGAGAGLALGSATRT